MRTCPECSTQNSETRQSCSKCGSSLAALFTATVMDSAAVASGSVVEPSKTTGSSISDTTIHGRFLPGTKVAGRYRIVSLAGKGGMGEVYRADDLKLGHPVALKFLPQELARDAKRLDSFLNEVRLSRLVAHPNVCRVYDVGEVDGQHFLSMEYIDGEDLKNLLRRIGRLPEDKGIHIAQELCAGLAAAHEKGVLHRDLKPANIMLDGRGQARITDFGISRLADSGPSREIAGTPAYMAPEQLAHGQTSIQSDLYSLGLILHEMFTGKPLHKGGSIQELLQAHADSTPAHPSALVDDLDPAVGRVILRCLEKEPHRRPKSARALAAGLPGGDPLAAALAAGETPSPEMVAAAGDEGMLTLKAGLASFAAVGIGLLLVCWMAQSTHLVNLVRMEKHPQFLAGDAARMMEKFGYHDPPVDKAFGFRYEGKDTVRYWYRQNPLRPFLAVDYWSADFGPSFNRVDESNPRWKDPGERGIELSPQGKLLRFRAIPPLVPEGRQPAEKLDWARWFPEDFTGFDLNALEPVVDMELRPPDAYDHLQVWKGQGAKSGATLIVEAAAYSGKPVYFEVFTEPQFERVQSSSYRMKPTGRGGSIFFSLYVSLLIVAVVLAWRNYVSRHSDRRGAFRVALFLFGSGTATWMLVADHTASVREQAIMVVGISQALFPAAEFWLGYTALEPFVRRLWPQLLISWSRLIDGRWRDPLIGRDMLVGCVIGITAAALHQLQNLPLTWLGLASSAGSSELSHPFTLAGLFPLIGMIISSQVTAVISALYCLMLLLSLRWALRKTILASCAFVLVCVLMVGLGSDLHHMLGWVMVTISMTLLVWTLVQFGFLTVIISNLIIALLLKSPITTNFSTWYAGQGLTAIAVVLSIAGCGFYISKGSQSIFADHHLSGG